MPVAPPCVGRLTLALVCLITAIAACDSPTVSTRTVAVPALEQWLSNMIAYGTVHAADAAYAIPLDGQVAGHVSDAHVWYYDGTRVFYQIADYTGDDKWVVIAEQAGAAYGDYVLATSSVHGWRDLPTWAAAALPA